MHWNKNDRELLRKPIYYISQVICPSDTVVYSVLDSTCFFQGIQVLWTPQDENDVLSEEKLLEDYSYLKPLCED